MVVQALIGLLAASCVVIIWLVSRVRAAHAMIDRLDDLGTAFAAAAGRGLCREERLRMQVAHLAAALPYAFDRDAGMVMALLDECHQQGGVNLEAEA